MELINVYRDFHFANYGISRAGKSGYVGDRDDLRLRIVGKGKFIDVERALFSPVLKNKYWEKIKRYNIQQIRSLEIIFQYLRNQGLIKV